LLTPPNMRAKQVVFYAHRDWHVILCPKSNTHFSKIWIIKVNQKEKRERERETWKLVLRPKLMRTGKIVVWSTFSIVKHVRTSLPDSISPNPSVCPCEIRFGPWTFNWNRSDRLESIGSKALFWPVFVLRSPHSPFQIFFWTENFCQTRVVVVS